MFRHFKGNFKGHSYDSDLPPTVFFQNATNCKEFGKFISNTLMERIANGTITVLGRVGECDPPFLVNLWIKDCPFSLDTLKKVPRLLEQKCIYDVI